jgi:hypothetical protein
VAFVFFVVEDFLRVRQNAGIRYAHRQPTILRFAQTIIFSWLSCLSWLKAFFSAPPREILFWIASLLAMTPLSDP